MLHVLTQFRFTDVHVRWAMLFLILAGNLPVPIVHAHDVANGTRQLALHIAIFHSARCDCEPHELHLHVVPPGFFGGSSLGGATGDESPAPDRGETCPPELAQVSIPLVLDCGREVVTNLVNGPSETGLAPRHFLETYPAASDLGGLWGVCRC